jgi:hypothetical protein
MYRFSDRRAAAVLRNSQSLNKLKKLNEHCKIKKKNVVSLKEDTPPTPLWHHRVERWTQINCFDGLARQWCAK